MDNDILYLFVPLVGLGGLLVVLIFIVQLAGINRKLRRANGYLAELARVARERPAPDSGA